MVAVAVVAVATTTTTLSRTKKGNLFHPSGAPSSKDDSIVAALKGFHGLTAMSQVQRTRPRRLWRRQLNALELTHSSEIRTELETRKKHVFN